MAQLWKKHDGGWTSTILDASGGALDAHHAGGARAAGVAPTGAARALLHRVTTAFGEEWLLLCAPGAGVTVNGDVPYAGAVVLRDRDLIRVAGADGALFFCTRHVAATETFGDAAADPGFRCARCRRRIEAGATIVRCPGCGIVHHESGTLPCWSYATTCALCSEPTALDDEPRWTPEAL